MMQRIFSSSSLSSSDSYNSLKDMDKPNHIACPICLMETNDNKILQCKHGICKACFKTLSATKPYKCPFCRKEYGKPLVDPVITSALALSFSIGGISI